MTAKRQLFRVAPVETPNGVITTFHLPHAFELETDVQPWPGRPAAVPLRVSSPTPGPNEYHADVGAQTIKMGTAPTVMYVRMQTTDLTVHSWIPRLDVNLAGAVNGVNKVFTSAEIPADYDQVELLLGRPATGLKLVPSLPGTSDFTFSGKTWTVGRAPFPNEGPPRASYFFADPRLAYEYMTGEPAAAAGLAANPFYVRMRDVARRLIDSKAGDFILMRKTQAQYDAQAGTPAYSVEQWAFRGAMVDDRRTFRYDGIESAEQKRRLVLGVLDVRPQIGDSIDVGGIPMDIVNVENVGPDGVTSCLYKMAVRQ